MRNNLTFTCSDPFRCPQCDRESIIGVLLVDDQDRHQHTWYLCTSWQGTRCGWTGWSVDAAPKRDAHIPAGGCGTLSRNCSMAISVCAHESAT